MLDGLFEKQYNTTCSYVDCKYVKCWQNLTMFYSSTWRDDRAVEGARLESVCTGNRTEGSNPSLSAIKISRTSGFFILFLCRTVFAGSCAMGACEPGQVRKEAALSGYFHVPQGCPVGAALQRSNCTA